MGQEIFARLLEIGDKSFNKRPIGLHIPGIPRRVEEFIGTSVFRALGANPEDAAHLARHELDHAAGNNRKLQAIGVLLDDKRRVVGATCEFVGDSTVMQKFEQAIAVGLTNMSPGDIDAVSWCIIHATAEQAQQMLNKIRQIENSLALSE